LQKEESLLAFIRRQLSATGAVLTGFRGNARVCLILEPLWGIPYNLYATYASVYMLALGCSATQIGLISSISLSLQTLFITGRLGRKCTSIAPGSLTREPRRRGLFLTDRCAALRVHSFPSLTLHDLAIPARSSAPSTEESSMPPFAPPFKPCSRLRAIRLAYKNRL
jgi:hypothetical protein